VCLGHDFQVGRLGVSRDQLQVDRRRSGGGAVLIGQKQALAAAAEVEVGVAEGMQVAGTAKALPGGGPARGVLAGARPVWASTPCPAPVRR
jgi:hypothetical protein